MESHVKLGVGWLVKSLISEISETFNFLCENKSKKFIKKVGAKNLKISGNFYFGFLKR